MEEIRNPFQGVLNIVRFNWHFYALAFGLVAAILLSTMMLSTTWSLYAYWVCGLIVVPTIISLSVSYYVYDLSGLYNFNWLNDTVQAGKTVNISAGFDETSALLLTKFGPSELVALDFYEPTKHTEISIRRARKAYPAFPNTKCVETNRLPLTDRSIDNLFVIFSAHEIRDHAERILFFKELNRSMKPGGQIIVVEHLRDFKNFLAYNIGFFHFQSRATWMMTFREAQLDLHQEIKFTPFITTFLLKSNGNTF